MNNKLSPIGLFRRDITDPEQLVATTIARHHLVDDLLEKLKRRVNKKSGQNHLYIGPRGIGKTHLLTLLQYGVETDSTLNSSYTIIRFPEESNRVLSFADLLLSIIDLLAEVDDDPQWRELHQKIETEGDDNVIIDTILPRLKHWHKQSGKVVLVLMENLDVLFTQQIKNKQDIHRIRGLLMDNSHIVLIGTAPVFFPALNDVKHPLYDFFDIQIIEELDQAQSLALIKTHMEWDKQDNLLRQFDQLKPRILAMHTLTGGNPRLIMMLYELIVQDNLIEIKTRFHQLLDRITPFYQDRLKDLPPQERALLETLALMRFEKRTPVNIAKKFRKPRHQTSVLLKRMTETGYLSVSTNPNDKRSRLYRIKEGFFDIWLAMNESRAQGKYLPYLVDFFTLWYASVEEREHKRNQLAKKLSELKEKEQQNALDILAYLSEASDQWDEKYQTKIELVLEQIKLGHIDQAKTTLNETRKITNTKPQRLMVWMVDKASHWSNSEQPENAIQQMEKVIAYWREQRSGDLEKVARLFRELSLDFSSHGLHKLHIALLQDQYSNCEGTEEKVNLLLQIARSEKSDGQLSTALETLNHTLGLTREIKNKKLEGATLNNMATTAHARGDYETALEYLNQSLAIRQEIGDKSGEGATLNNISQIYHARGDYETALEYLNQSLAIRQEIGDKSGEGATLNNISQIYHARGDYETALEYLNQSLAIQQEIGDKSGEGVTLNNISQIYHARGDYETALEYLNQSLAIQQEIGDKSGEGATLNNMATTAHARGDYETALEYLNQSLAIQQEIGDKSGEGATLNNISQIYDARGDYETALEYLNQSLAIQQEIGDKSGEGATLNNMATNAHARGDYETALEYLNQSLAIRQEIGDKSGEGTTLNNISQIFKVRGNYETALEYLNQSLAIQQEIGDKSGEGVTLNNISQIFKVHGDYETALEYLNQSLAIQQEIGDKSGKGATLNNISQIYDARGDYETALEYLNQSLAIQQEIGDIAGLCASLFNIGHIHLQHGEAQKAMQAWLKVYQIAKKINLAQVLGALENLAKNLGLDNGLESWEKLAGNDGA